MVAVLIVLLLGQEPPPPEAPPAPPSKWIWFPEDLLYRHALADPRAPYAGTRFQFPIHREDDLKIENVLAGHRAMVRLKRENDAFELQAEAAAFGRFDINQSWDMDGIDYRFGFPVVWRRGSLAVKLHPWHVTSHLGDEFIEREGRTRIKYARNQLALGVAWELADAWRVYGEAGWGFSIGDPNEPWYAQGGIEFVDDLLGADAPAVYVAANVTSYQETDWGALFTMQAGLWFRPERSPRGFRLGLEYFRGHSALTQFFTEHDHYWSFGLWIHF